MWSASRKGSPAGNRPIVTYRLNDPIDLDVAFDAIPGDYARASRPGQAVRKWRAGVWEEEMAPLESSGWLLLLLQRLGRGALYLFGCTVWQSLGRSFGRKDRLWWVETEMTIWLVLLAGAWAFEPVLSGGNWIVMFLATVRVANIVGYSLYSVLEDSTTPATAFASARRSVSMGLLNLVTLAFAFAAVERFAANQWPGRVYSSPLGLTQSAYGSWTTLLTLGAPTPANWLGRLLVAAELGSGVLVIAVTLAAVLGGLNVRSRRP